MFVQNIFKASEIVKTGNHVKHSLLRCRKITFYTKECLFMYHGFLNSNSDYFHKNSKCFVAFDGDVVYLFRGRSSVPVNVLFRPVLCVK